MAVLATLAAFASVARAADPVPVAAYTFADGSFASSVGGAPALTAVNPLGTSGFGTATVNGASTSVYNFTGNTAPAEQAGLSLNIGSLITNHSVYSVEIVFSFQQVSGYRRILDVQDRSSDNDFYILNGALNIYPVASGAAFTADSFHDVVLLVNNGTVNFYLDGGAATTVNTDVMTITGNTPNFFLDNYQGPAQSEYSSGSVASIRVYNEAVSTGTLPVTPAVPEPDALALMLAGPGFVGFAAKGRRSA